MKTQPQAPLDKFMGTFGYGVGVPRSLRTRHIHLWGRFRGFYIYVISRRLAGLLINFKESD